MAGLLYSQGRLGESAAWFDRPIGLTPSMEAAVNYAESVAASDPSAQWTLVEVYLGNSEWEKSQPILKSLGPKFCADGEIDVSPSELVLAIQVASSLRDDDGFSQRAHYLAAQALKTK